MNPPAIRVHLLTCRRAHLLPRALASLQAQTFADWVCEVHNDAPEDPGPAEIVRRCADPRVRLVAHEHNLGAVGTFNAIHREIPEPFFSILEDDNWWEPELLAELKAALDRTPEAAAAWANMRIWLEGADGTWRDTGRCIWPAAPAAGPRLFHWAQPLQFNDALHSNGAMLMRARHVPGLVVPAATPFDMMEAVRERLLPHPLILIPRPLAHYALTTGTARSGDPLTWVRCKALLGAAFLREARLEPADIERIWTGQRALRPRSTDALFLAAWLARRFSFLRGAHAADWSRFCLGAVRHPVRLCRALRAVRVHAAVWQCLLPAVRRRFAETRALGRPDVDSPGVAVRDS